MRKHGFAPILPEQEAKILVLGSMPGEKSLAEVQYYAHRHNLFWHMMSIVCREILPETYSERVQLLKRHGIAVWDVCDSCIREGSLDTAIQEEQANAIPALLSRHPSIKLIAFNGQKAANLFRKYFKEINIPQLTLPSTSPANAGKTKAEKEKQWLLLRNFL